MTGEGSRTGRPLVWLMAAALVARVVVAVRAPIIEVDGAYWTGLAAALERGDWRHGLSTAWPPLYPALIAALVRVARLVGLTPAPSLLEGCARAVSVLAGTLALVPLYAIARRLVSPRAAVVAVTLAAFHPRLLQYSGAALSEATFTLALLGALALLVAREQEDGPARPARGRETASGALFGLAYLARPEGLPLAAALWIGALFRRPAGAAGGSPRAARTLAARLRPAFVAGALIVALPWMIFLHDALGRWSLGEKGEYNFWRSFAAEYARDFPAPAGLAARVNESPEIAPPPSGGGVNALGFALRHPGVVLARCARNLGTILASTLPVTLYWWLVPLALLALFRPRPLGAWPVLVTLVAMPLFYAPFSVDRRFFVPAVPLLLIACASGIERVEAWLARRAGGTARARRAVNAGLAVLAALAIAYGLGKGAGYDEAPEHRRAGEWLRARVGPGGNARTGAPPQSNTPAVPAFGPDAPAASDPPVTSEAGHPMARAARGNRPVVMSRKPWVAFYSGGLIATLPDAEPDSLVALARGRGAVLVADGRSAGSDRPRLAPFLDPGGAPAGLSVLHEEAGPPALVLYRAGR